jgi:hypothetical protein
MPGSSASPIAARVRATSLPTIRSFSSWSSFSMVMAVFP